MCVAFCFKSFWSWCGSHWSSLFTLLQEIVILVWVTLEFIVRLWSAGCRSRYQGLAGRFRFLQRPLCIIGECSAVKDGRYWWAHVYTWGRLLYWASNCLLLSPRWHKAGPSAAGATTFSRNRNCFTTYALSVQPFCVCLPANWKHLSFCNDRVNFS